MELFAAFARPWKKHARRLFNWLSPSQLQLLLIFSSARRDFYLLVIGLKMEEELLKESQAPCYFRAPVKKLKFYSEL